MQSTSTSSSSSSSSGKPVIKRTYGSRSHNGVAARASTSLIHASPPLKRARLTSPVATPPLASSATSSSQSSASTPVDAAASDPSALLLQSSSPVRRSSRTEVNKSTLPARKPIQSSKQDVKLQASLAKGKGRAMAKPAKLEQMHLNLSNAPLATTCAKCQMSYMRGAIEDEETHRRYCKKASSGIEWPFACDSNSSIEVIRDGIWLGKGKDTLEGKIVMVEGRVGGALAKKLDEVATTVNQSLNATSLAEQDTKSSRYILFLALPTSSTSSAPTRTTRVIGCAIVSRIAKAYRATSGGSSSDASLLRFGEDEGAIFCSPTPVPALLGVHRIWTSPSHRRLGIAGLLLDAAAERAIYGCPVFADERQDKFAFSQPSNAGQRLFSAWTGTSSMLIFVD